MGWALIDIDVQLAVDDKDIPATDEFQQWAAAALAPRADNLSLVIRLVDEAESRQLNQQFRHKDAPTNVLSFPFEAPPGVESNHLGDLVICAPIVAREASEQGKALAAHWAHMVVHGCLHLLGYDHQSDEEAESMERLERETMERLGFADPYEPG